MTEQELANVIWDIKEVIRNSYDDSEVEDVILPFTLLRRLDCVLEDKYEVILEELSKCEENLKKYKLQALMKKNGITFFNMSGLSLKKLLNAPDHIGDSFKTTPNRSLGFGIKLSSSPLSLHIRCNLKPKYHPMVLLPLSA